MDANTIIDINEVLQDIKSLGECEIKLKSYFARQAIKK